MGCAHPIQAARGADGKVRILPRRFGPLTLKQKLAAGERAVELPCGRCVLCKTDKAQDWATRCQHEANQHRHPDGTTNGSFVTLTFSDDGLAVRELEVGARAETLRKADLSGFLKRLRANRHRRAVKRGENSAEPIKFFGVGEYGEQYLRPHYHVLLFGEDFSEERVRCEDENGNTYFQSPILAGLWQYGLTDIRPITTETTNYVCRYVQKKLNNQALQAACERVREDTGEVFTVEPEFALMSRRPGIGASWFDEYSGDVYPAGYVRIAGKKRRVPRFYKERLRAQDPAAYEEAAAKARAIAAKNVKETTKERRQVKKEIAERRNRDAKQRKLS